MIGLLLSGESKVTVFTNVENFRNRADTAVIYFSETEPNYFDYTDIVPQPAQKIVRHNCLSEGKLLRWGWLRD